MPNALKEKMSYGDFIIEKEHKFLRNIFLKEELISSDAIKNIESFHEHFSKFLQIVVYLQQSINTMKDFSECFHDELIDLIEHKISDVPIKSNQKVKNFKIYIAVICFRLSKNNAFSMDKI